MCGILTGAALLGVIIMVMEEGEFPGWGSMILCTLAAIVPMIIARLILPPELFILGLAAVALCMGLAVSAVCGMSVKRATLAGVVWLAIQVAISLGLNLISR